MEQLTSYIMKLDKITPDLEAALLSDGRKGAEALLIKRRRMERLKQKEQERLERMLFEEKLLWKSGFKNIAGVDEAGRGPLAGPVVAAAVILAPDTGITGLNDSKKLTSEKRSLLYEEIVFKARAYGLGSATKSEIDRLNIHQATFLAMKRALKRLAFSPECILVDGFSIPETPFVQKAIIGGDSLSLSIAAASVLAKVARDMMMQELDKQYPGYGFARNMGYGTEEHRHALNRLGPCPEHRVSFRLKYD
jgi:ribonuclease HII